jgi:acetoin utilization protein AcuB
MNLKNNIFRTGSSGPTEQYRRPVRVTDAMTTGIVTLGPNDSFDRAIELIVSRDYQHLVVTDEEEKVLGLVSKGDIVGTRWDISEWRNKQVHQAMTANPITVTMDTPLSDAISTMISKQLNCLPVVKHSGALCGLLTATDIMKSYQRMLEGTETEPHG